MFFENWFGVFRILLVAIIAYLAMILFLRISGKRTLSKWNAFDSIATIATGSILATVIVSKDVVLLEGVFAFGLVIALQFAATWLILRYSSVDKLMKAVPTLLMLRGEFLQDAMRTERVTEEEVKAALRSAGLSSLDDAHAVVLETDGSFSVVKEPVEGSRSTLQGIPGFLAHPVKDQLSALTDASSDGG